MIRRPPRSTQSRSSAASDVYKRQHSKNDENCRESTDDCVHQSEEGDQAPEDPGAESRLDRLQFGGRWPAGMSLRWLRSLPTKFHRLIPQVHCTARECRHAYVKRTGGRDWWEAG